MTDNGEELSAELTEPWGTIASITLTDPKQETEREPTGYEWYLMMTQIKMARELDS